MHDISWMVRYINYYYNVWHHAMKCNIILYLNGIHTCAGQRIMFLWCVLYYMMSQCIITQSRRINNNPTTWVYACVRMFDKQTNEPSPPSTPSQFFFVFYLLPKFCDAYSPPKCVIKNVRLMCTETPTVPNGTWYQYLYHKKCKYTVLSYTNILLSVYVVAGLA